MREKRIKGFEDYGITDSGKVISYKRKKPIELKPWGQKNGQYLNVGLSKNGKVTNFRVHRLVAEHFIEKDINKNEVDHIDRNPLNNDYKNLRWVNRKENLENSKTKFTRNYFNCKLINEEKKYEKDFRTISEASSYASEKFGCSKSYLQRKVGNKSNGYYIKKV